MNGQVCKLFITKAIRSTLVCDGSDFAELRGIRPFGAEKFGLGLWDARWRSSWQIAIAIAEPTSRGG
jgi:hypothetical protein